MIGRTMRQVGATGVVALAVSSACGSLGPASQADPTDAVTTTYALPPASVDTTIDPAPMPSTTAPVGAAPPTGFPGAGETRWFPSAMPGQVITFRIASPIALLAGDADVWRLAPGTEADIKRIAGALGVDAPSELLKGNVQIGDGVGPTVAGYSPDGSGNVTSWSYYVGALGAPRCPTPGSSAVLPSGYPDCVDPAAATPIAALVDRAYALARAIGFAVVAGAEVVNEADQVRVVTLFERLGDLWNPVPFTMTWSYDDLLVGAQGSLATPSVVGRALRIGTEVAVAHLGENGLARPVEPAAPPGATPTDGSTVAPGTTVVAFPRFATGPPTTAPASPTSVAGASGTTTITTAPSIDVAGAFVLEGQISFARPALLVDPTDPSGRLIVPAYVFTTQYGEVITTAVDPAAVDPFRGGN